MDNFKIIYKILRTLEKAMEIAEFDISMISHEELGINITHWKSIMEMLLDNGYVKGISIIKTVGSNGIKIDDIRITLKGLEYLSDNSLMNKAANIAKGIKEIMLGL